MPVLLLGGTVDARELLAAATAAGFEVIESVAGRTRQARAAADARIGGFGGIEGLIDYLRSNRITAVLDATHPFATQMTRHAARACAATGTPLLRFVRPGWADHPGAVHWRWVADHPAAARAAAGWPGRVLLTVGRQPLPHYRALPDVLARVAEWPGGDPPAGWQIIAARGPFELAGELDLLRDQRIGLLVSKDSGGAQTAAKLDAAGRLGIPVIMVARTPTPAGVPEASDVPGALAWLATHRPPAQTQLSQGQDPPPHR